MQLVQQEPLEQPEQLELLELLDRQAQQELPVQLEHQV